MVTGAVAGSMRVASRRPSLRLNPLVAYAPLSFIWFIILSWPYDVIAGGLWWFIGVFLGTNLLSILVRKEVFP